MGEKKLPCVDRHGQNKKQKRKSSLQNKSIPRISYITNKIKKKKKQKMGQMDSKDSKTQSTTILTEKGKEDEITFIDIIGHHEIKLRFTHIINIIVHNQSFNGWRGILLVGSPGVGKTLLAKALANTCNCSFFPLSASIIGENIHYESEKATRIKEAFEKARKKIPAIIFIDELDLIISRSDYVTAELLTQLDGFHSCNDKIFVLGAANSLCKIPSTLVRAGRLNPILYLYLPSEKDRIELFKYYLKNTLVAEDLNFTYFAHITSQFSGAEIKAICQNACLQLQLRLKEEKTKEVDDDNTLPEEDDNNSFLFKEEKKKEFITNIDLERSIDETYLGVPIFSRVRSQEEDSVCAYHEAGHLVALLKLPETGEILKVTILPHEKAEGVVLMRWPENKPKTLTYFEHSIIATFSGMEGCKKKFGHYINGNNNDLKNIESLLKEMIFEGMLSWQKLGDIEDTLVDQHKKHNTYLKDLSEKAASLIQENAELHEKIAQILLKKKTLYKKDLVDLL